MALSGESFLIRYTSLVLMLISNLSMSNGIETSISCLNSIKDSIQDPYSRLGSWIFENHSLGLICGFVGVECWNFKDERVLQIQLSHMGLTGPFPRGLEYCTSLTSLDLSYNKLSGPIPVDIWAKLKFITRLDLSYNQFSGAIPPGITTSRYLNALFLQDNRLEGPIPQEIGFLDRLKVLNVAGNALTGPVPNFLCATISAEYYASNKGLCGGPLEPCEVDEDSAEDDLFGDGIFISAFATGWVLGFNLLVVRLLFGVPSVPAVMARMCRGNEGEGLGVRGTFNASKISRLEKFVTRMSLAELSNATSNFSRDNVIGFGKTGVMYKACLPNGWSLAMKRLYTSQISQEQFINEVLTLGAQRHDNLIPLIGFCVEKEERLLVYKYMPNGNLYDCLHPINNESGIISWKLRMKIAIGIADGLSWLHNSCRVRIFHDNMNSGCILLDQNFAPKISNLWEAKFSNRESSGASSWTLLSSFESIFQLNSDKKDVYCFGLVLLELMTGKEPSEDFEVVDSSSCSSSLSEVMFSALQEQGFDERILPCFEVARDCLKSKRNERPSMIEVCSRLRAIGQN